MPEPIFDQAAGLRRMSAPHNAKVVAITGGKGGVGKTLTAVNLGAALARLGRSTMLLDADFGLANVDVLLGMKARLNLEHVMAGQCALEDVIQTASSGLRVVPATSGNVEHGGLEPRAARGAHRRLQPAPRAARRAARRHGGGTQRRRHHVQRGGAARRRARLRRAGVADGRLWAHQGALPAATELPVRDRRESRRHAGARARAVREAHARLPSLPGHHARPISATCRRTTTCARRFAAKRRSSKRFRAVPAARAFQRLARAVDGWEAPAQARGGVEFFMERLVRPDGKRAAGVQ